MNIAPLNKVFKIDHGNKFDLNKMSRCGLRDDAVTFVGRSSERNGVVAFVEHVRGAEPFPAGSITVALGGSALSSFVQKRPFYTAQNLDVLTPLSSMSLDEKLYYCLSIEANRFRYSTFGREANRTLKYLLVPTRESVPSWVDGATPKAIEALCGELREFSARLLDAQDMMIPRTKYTDQDIMAITAESDDDTAEAHWKRFEEGARKVMSTPKKSVE